MRIENIYSNLEKIFNNLKPESNIPNWISTINTDIEEEDHESNEKEADYEKMKEELRNLDVESYFENERYEQEEYEEVEDKRLYDDYRYDDRFILNSNDPNFLKKLHERISDNRPYDMTPKNVEKNINSFLGQFESSKQKARGSIRIYEMLWNAVRKTVKILRNCEIEELDVYYYEDSFTKKDFPNKPLDLDDPFYPFYKFVKDFVNYEFKNEDFDELTTIDNLTDQPFIYFLLNSFEILIRTYKDSIDKEQKIVIDITNDTKKVITNDKKRVIHNLLIENIQSMREIFNFSRCNNSFRSKLKEIDELINQSQEKIKDLNVCQRSKPKEQNSKKNSLRDKDILEIWSPEINYEPSVKKNKEKCKKMVFKKGIENVENEALDCVILPVKKDKELFFSEEYDSTDYSNDDVEDFFQEPPVIKDKYNNDLNYNLLSNINPSNSLLGQLKLPLSSEGTNLAGSACGVTGMVSFCICYSTYLLIGFLFIMLAIFISYIVIKTIQKRHEKQNIKYLQCQDEANLLPKYVINPKVSPSILKIEEVLNGRF